MLTAILIGEITENYFPSTFLYVPIFCNEKVTTVFNQAVGGGRNYFKKKKIYIYIYIYIHTQEY
jgi:hypothetical protein